jgi:hypothetical protein
MEHPGIDACPQKEVAPQSSPSRVTHAAQPHNPPKESAMQNELNFAYEFFSADDLKYRGALNIPTVVSSTFASVRTVLQFDPGERWNYGCNIDWLGRIVEQQRGKRLGEVFKERILGHWASPTWPSP